MTRREEQMSFYRNVTGWPVYELSLLASRNPDKALAAVGMIAVTVVIIELRELDHAPRHDP